MRRLNRSALPRAVSLFSRTTALVSALAVASPIVAPLHAQSIQGLILVGAARRSAPGATLVLLDRKHAPVDTAQADVFGAFSLQAPASGRYYILVRRSGYYPILSERIDLRDTETRNDTLFLRGDDAELNFRQIFAKDLTRLFGSSISAGMTRSMMPEQVDSLRDKTIHLGDIVRTGRFVGLQYYQQSGCLRFSGEPACAQLYVDGLPVNMRAEQISTQDIEAIMAVRSAELGYFANASRDNSNYGVVMVYTSRFASR